MAQSRSEHLDSAKNLCDGRRDEAHLDAAESLPHLLTGRLRPALPDQAV
jgi:hypothetical protein